MDNCKIIAHRGANVYAPQNTLPAFIRAAELGADGFETDIHLTRDGVPVICHNYTVDETSNGMGSISKMEYSELLGLDFGSYFSEKYKGTRILTLEEFLTVCEKYDIKLINLELKPLREGETGEKLVQTVLDMVHSFGFSNRVIISSFDRVLLKLAKELDPHCKTGFLYHPAFHTLSRQWAEFTFVPVTTAKSLGCESLHPMLPYVTSEYVRRAHKAGLKINVWTVDSERQIKRMKSLGVDGIITDCPDRAKRIIESKRG